jgi:peptide deformylase
LRLAVLDCSDDHNAPMRLANPEVIWASDETSVYGEGSPNAPEVYADVTRPASVTVRFLDEAGAQQEQTFDGLWATSVQHQIDHLDGKLFFDRLKPVKRRMIIDRLTKAKRAAKRAGAA